MLSSRCVAGACVCVHWAWPFSSLSQTSSEGGRGLPLLRCLVMVRYKFVNRNSSSVIILLPFIVLLLLLLLLPPSGLKFSCHFNSTVVLVLLHVKAASQRCYHISLLLSILLQLSLLLLPLPPPLLLLLLRLLLQLFNALLFMLSALMRIPVAPPPTTLHPHPLRRQSFN